WNMAGERGSLSAGLRRMACHDTSWRDIVSSAPTASTDNSLRGLPGFVRRCGREVCSMRRAALLSILLVVSHVFVPRAAGSPALGDLGKVGTVEFPTSCSAKAQPEFLRGVALLHSFFYEEARRVFTSAAT